MAHQSFGHLTATTTSTASNLSTSSRPPLASPVLSLLRPGKRPSRKEAAQILKHVIRRIRHHWPRVEIVVRGNDHYGTPEVMDMPEHQGHGYILGLPGNARLNKIGRQWCEDVEVRRARSSKTKVRRFIQTAYSGVAFS